MTNFIEQKRFIKYWLVIFALHLSLLLFAVWNVYAVRRLAPEPPEVYVTNDLIFNLSFLVGMTLFGASLVFGKTLSGFVRSLVFSLLIAFIGLFVLFAVNSFYFLLWFIIGLSGMEIHLFRFQKALEKN
jgi:hypothetical protein